MKSFSFKTLIFLYQNFLADFPVVARLTFLLFYFAKAFLGTQIWSFKFEIDGSGLVKALQRRRGRRSSSWKDLRRQMDGLLREEETIE